MSNNFNILPHISVMHHYSYDVSGQFLVDMSLNISGILDVKNLIGSTPMETSALIKSVNLESLTFSEIREWMGSAWTYTDGNHEMRQLDIEFRDINGGILYKNWEKTINKLRTRYPEEKQWTIKIKKITSSSFKHLTGATLKDNLVVNTRCAIIRGMSGEKLDSEDSNFTNFTITFFYDPFPFELRVNKVKI